MGLFGKKVTNYADKSLQNKEEIFTLLNKCKEICKNAAPLSEIKKAISKIQKQGPYSDSDALNIDNDVIKSLNKVYKQLKKQDFTDITSRLKNVVKMIIEREKYCSREISLIGDVQGNEEDTRIQMTEEEELLSQLEKRYSEVVILKVEFDSLKNASEDDYQSQARLDQLKIEIKSITLIMDELILKIKENNEYEIAAEMIEIQAYLDSIRQFDEVDAQMIQDSLDERMAIQKEQEEINQRLFDVLN